MKLLLQALFGPFLLSIATTLVGIVVLGCPLVVTFRKTQNLRARLRWATRGVVFGLLVLPGTLFLYLHFFTDPLRALLLGFPGVLLFFHFEPFGGMSMVSHGIVVDPAAGTLTAIHRGLMGLLFWPVVYGLLGYAVGQLVEFRKRRAGGHSI